MASISVEAQAKINLSLDVTGRLPNGYHTLDMIMQTVGLTDTIRVERSALGIHLTCEHPLVPCNEGNLAWRAAQAFFDALDVRDGVRIHIIKRIPVAAGLAGGSTDCAAVLHALNVLYDQPFSMESLAVMGKRLGADVPYCLYGGTRRARGIGEVLDALPSFAGVPVVLVKPPFPVSTQEVFRAFRLDAPGVRPDTEALLQNLQQGDVAGVATGMCNVLESVTLVQHPMIGVLQQRLLEAGALGARMSGSGPTVFGLFGDMETAQQACDVLSQEYIDCFAVSTTDGGY